MPDRARSSIPSGARRHLLASTCVVSAALAGYMLWIDLSPNSSLVVLVFLTGAFGGLLGAFRRFRLIASDEESASGNTDAAALAIHAYVSPVIGGMFGIVMYLVFLSGIVRGDFFPEFRNLDREYDGLFRLFHDMVPAENSDAIKLVFWAFVSGFSERFVPDLVGRVRAGRR